MESPFNRPVAANLIKKAITEYMNRPIDWCGYSLEMTIYTELNRAGYLTETAKEQDEN